MDKLLFKRILVAALTVLAIMYVLYLLISANFDMYPTENAVQVTVTNKISTNGFIVRDETVINNDTSGVLSYSCDEGEQIGAGGEIAKIYASEEDARAQTLADSLETQKSDLESLQNNSSVNTIGIDTINNSINNNIISYIDNINNENLSSAFSDANNLLYSINQRYLYTGKYSDFNSQIESLQNEIDSLKNSAGNSIGVINTDKAGYFSEFCDGFESSIKYSDIDSVKLSDLENVNKQNVSQNCAGKIVSGLNWYVLCKVSADEATRLSLWNSDVSISFSDATSMQVPASIYRIHQESKDSDAIVVLECDYMDDSLIEARYEPIEIGLGTYTGLIISKKAIHDDYVTKTTYDENDTPHTEKKKVQGVYVMYGSEVQFKEISIIYSDEDYVICDPSPSEDDLFSDETVSMYDKVIIEGDDLYDGKIAQ